MFFALCLWGTQSNAQNVTIGPDNGSLITGQAGGNQDDSGIKRGMASMWRHEQLALTMTTSDIANLTSAGELADPSCAIDKYTVDGKERLLIGAGQTQTFMVVSLPKGYRITGYRLVMQPNVYGTFTLHTGKDSWSIGSDDSMSFFETPAWSSGSPYGDNTHSGSLECPDSITAAHEIGNSANKVMQNNNAENRAKEFVIQRTSQTPDDMTNQLHFFFASKADNRNQPYQYAVTIKSFEIFFTAEGSFDAQVTPAMSGAATDYVTSPFTTSKMDVGAVEYSNGIYHYDYTGVRDLQGYLHIYQDNTCDVAKYPQNVDGGEKNIYSLNIDGQGAFAYGNDTYFIEPPTTIETASGWKQPIGFRVVGATFNYKYGTPVAGGTITETDGLYVQYTSGNTTRYLNGNLDFLTNTDDTPRTLWHKDDYGNIYIGDTDRKYLACYGSSEQERVISLSSVATGAQAKWNLRIDEENNNILYYTDSQNHKFILNVVYIQEGGTYHYRGYVTVDATNNLATANEVNEHTVTIPAFNPGPYTLKIYDKTGTALATPAIEVNSAADEGTFKLEGLNNDAVKFEISGLTPNDNGKTQALVDVTLELQALNPYINSMNITCTDQPKKFQLTQTFTSSDFRVSGGKFIFYIPDEYKDQTMTISFADLYSSYGDETYPKGSNKHYGRYSFVTSKYFKENPNLYNTDPEEPYTNKVITSTAGNVRFEFNNAEELTSGSNTSFLQEYLIDPYGTYDATTNKYGYIGYPDPDWDGTGTQKTGKYDDCTLVAAETEGDTNRGTYFVFTADETRYNIAPSTSWQHRYYAFYRMDVVLLCETYKPSLTWTKLYDKTCSYSEDTFPDPDKADTPAGKVSTDAMFGVKLATTLEDGTAMTEYGYLTTKSVSDAIDAAITAENTTATGNVPTSKSQILYVDASELLSMYDTNETTTTTPTTGEGEGEGEGTQTQVTYTLSDLINSLADNALVFMPENTTSTLDNVAYLKNDVFYAGKDIVLTDRKPFYSPYEIQVDAANKAIYTRVLTLPDYGKDVLATVMLPFTLKVSDGVHTNVDESTISLWEMKSSDLSPAWANSHDYYGIGYFQAVSGTSTSANVPYLVNMDKQGSQGSTNSFIASQTGGKIFATTNMKTRTLGKSGYNGGTYEYLYTGTTVTDNKVDVGATGTVSFTPEGSYAGHIYDRAESEAIFYFGNNMFLNLYTLKNTKRYLYMYPFRGVYTFDGSVASVNSLNGLQVSFDDPSNLDAIWDISKANVPDLAVRTGKGFIEITSAKDQMVNVLSINGTSYSRVNMNAGDSKTVALPAGVYVVNNVKIIVK